MELEGSKRSGLLCDLCDEAYLTPEVSREIDKIVKDFREGNVKRYDLTNWSEHDPVFLLQRLDLELASSATISLVLMGGFREYEECKVS